MLFKWSFARYFLMFFTSIERHWRLVVSNIPWQNRAWISHEKIKPLFFIYIWWTRRSNLKLVFFKRCRLAAILYTDNPIHGRAEAVNRSCQDLETWMSQYYLGFNFPCKENLSRKFQHFKRGVLHILPIYLSPSWFILKLTHMYTPYTHTCIHISWSGNAT